MAAPEREAGRDGFASEVLAWAGAYLISFVGIIHLLQAEELFEAAAYLGFLFLVNFLACAVVAVALARGGWRRAWLVGTLICAGAVAGFVVSRVFGLPGYEEAVGQWLNFPAGVVILIELAFLAVSPLALTSRGRSAVAQEESKLEHEAE